GFSCRVRSILTLGASARRSGQRSFHLSRIKCVRIERAARSNREPATCFAVGDLCVCALRQRHRAQRQQWLFGFAVHFHTRDLRGRTRRYFFFRLLGTFFGSYLHRFGRRLFNFAKLVFLLRLGLNLRRFRQRLFRCRQLWHLGF